jgi:hypothetical protein
MVCPTQWVPGLTGGKAAHPHLAPRFKEKWSYTYASLLGLRGLFEGELTAVQFVRACVCVCARARACVCDVG